MDQGIRLDARQVQQYLLKNHKGFDWFFRVFQIENDGPHVWIHEVRDALNTDAITLLQHFGYGIDLKPLQEEKKLIMKWQPNWRCDSCNKIAECVTTTDIKVCYSCLCEMVIFYEMEKEKRDSRTEEVPKKPNPTKEYWYQPADQRLIRNEGV